MIESKQGFRSPVALITRSVTTTAKAVQEARHLAMPTLALAAIIAILYFGRIFFITAITAIIIAFILEPFVALLIRIRLPRAIATFVVCTIALLFLYVIGLAAFTQIAAIYSDLPKYGARIGELVDGIQQKIEGLEEQTYRLVVPARQREAEAQKQAEAQRQQAAKTAKRKAAPAPQTQTQPIIIAPAPGVIPEVRIHEETTPVGEYLRSRLNDFYQVVLMISFVPFLVYFMLSWRDHLNRTFLQFFHGEDRLIAARSLAGIADMVRAFVVGNFILGLIMALFSSIMFWQIGLSYPLLVGPVSGFLSLAPYVGLPLALIPPMFAAVAVNKVSVYLLVLFAVVLLHLIAMNLLYPKLVGSRVHLNPLVVTFSLMLWGFLWDAPGLALAIPITAGLKAVCDNVKDLRPIGKFLGD
jgi:predicted PurR-regulated permease PerM